MKIGRGILAVLGLLLAGPATHASTNALCQGIYRQLQGKFDKWLENPAAYRQKALRECGSYPEGQIYPFLIPALGYANLAYSREISTEQAASQMRKLIDLAIPLVSKYVDAPDGDLLQLQSYRHQGTFLTTLNLAMSSYALICDDGRYAELNDHVSSLLIDALKQGKGAAIASYPEYTWYFDTITAFASLDIWKNKNAETDIERLYAEHMEWRQEYIMLKSGLPRAYMGGPSRGCDLSMQVCLLTHIDAAAAKALYAKYVEQHWIEKGLFYGFAEWPNGYAMPVGGDVDSGPVLFGIGGTASGIGIGAAFAAGDAVKSNRLIAELIVASTLIHSSMELNPGSGFAVMVNRYAPVDLEYYSGFLYGDCSLFYALTWAPYPAQQMETQSPDAGETPLQ